MLQTSSFAERAQQLISSLRTLQVVTLAERVTAVCLSEWVAAQKACWRFQLSTYDCEEVARSCLQG